MGLENLTPPSGFSLPGVGPTYGQAFPAVGLASLMQGVERGVELANQMNLQRRAIDENAAMRQALLGVRSSTEQEREREDAARNTLMSRALDIREEAAKTKAAGKNNADPEMGQAIDQYADLLDKTKNVNRLALWAESKVPGTLASQLATARANVAMMVPKRLSGRSNFPEIEKAESGFNILDPYDVALDKAKRMRELVGGPTAAANSGAMGQIHTYPSGRQVKWNGTQWEPVQ